MLGSGKLPRERHVSSTAQEVCRKAGAASATLRGTKDPASLHVGTLPYGKCSEAATVHKEEHGEKAWMGMGKKREELRITRKLLMPGFQQGWGRYATGLDFSSVSLRIPPSNFPVLAVWVPPLPAMEKHQNTPALSGKGSQQPCPSKCREKGNFILVPLHHERGNPSQCVSATSSPSLFVGERFALNAAVIP